jgi:hypothetical protein
MLGVGQIASQYFAFDATWLSARGTKDREAWHVEDGQSGNTCIVICCRFHIIRYETLTITSHNKFNCSITWGLLLL